MMDDTELLRYSRHIMLPEIDIDGQERLIASRVLIVGVGGLGSPVAMYLAAAGVGSLVISDDDVVDLSNLQRQIVHGSADLDRPKVDSARDRLLALNPGIAVEALPRRLGSGELAEWADRVDVIVDASDNFATRFDLNRASLATGTPLVSGAAVRFEGQVSVFAPQRDGSPCYRCLYDDRVQTQESCTHNGVLAPLLGIIGSVQAAEVIKLLTGVGQPLIGRLLLLDARSMEWQQVTLRRDPHCPACGISA